MSAEFRIVHFLSDPFLGGRIPVAALLRDRDDNVRVIRARHVPGAECLGGAKYAAALRMVLDCLEGSPAFDRLPQAVGPFATVAEPMPVPEGVHDPALWLRLHVLPTVVSDDGGAAREREPNRSRVGYRFFESWNIQGFVKKRFKLREHWNSLFTSRNSDMASVASTGPISHWVEGPERILLMEPLIPGRHGFPRDLQDVARNFAAFRFHLERLKSKKQVSLVTYLMGSQDRQRRDEAKDSLREIAHEVVDLSDSRAEEHLVNEVRTVGESA
jgi:hypothetical protein